jgi:hypothetical protein
MAQTAANMHLAIPPLVALESHPEFQQGIRIAQEVFLEHHAPTPLTENEIINELNEGLASVGNGPSYFYHLGFVFGFINQGLAYAPTPS